ncbi:MAG: DUF4190 domain-containing protein [Bacteroidales bacterium]|nr:DUF4190 domain-containing protein [Bacteroidales bacterium]
MKVKNQILKILCSVIILSQILISCGTSEKTSLPCSSFSNCNNHKVLKAKKRKDHKVMHVQTKNKKAGKSVTHFAKKSHTKKPNNSSGISGNPNPIYYNNEILNQINYQQILKISDILIASKDNSFIPLINNFTSLVNQNKSNKYVHEEIFIFYQENECDTIILNNGDKINAQVVKIEQNEIIYKECETSDETIFSIDKSTVSMIKYFDGNTEIFTEDKTALTSQETAKPKTHMLGLFGLFLVVIGLFFPWYVAMAAAAFALLFGIISLNKIKKNPKKFKGKGLAIISIVVGVAILVLTFFIGFVHLN